MTCCSHIINISQRIQVIAGQPLDDEDSRKVFPSFVWLLRDVLLSLPKGVENLKTYFLEKVISPCEKSNEGSIWRRISFRVTSTCDQAFFLSLSSATANKGTPDRRLRVAQTYRVVTMVTRPIWGTNSLTHHPLLVCAAKKTESK